MAVTAKETCQEAAVFCVVLRQRDSASSAAHWTALNTGRCLGRFEISDMIKHGGITAIVVVLFGRWQSELFGGEMQGGVSAEKSSY
jgi:hypothetical protein